MSKLIWLAMGAVLTTVLYLPVWLAYGVTFYHGIHPDYWATATPTYILPMSAVVSTAILFLGKLVFRRK